MKTIIALLILLTLQTSAYSAESFLIHKGFITGQRFLELTESQQNAYAMGVLDGLFLSPFLGGSEKRTTALGACAEGMSDKQLSAVLSTYLRDNPGQWHQSAHGSMFVALKKVCPAFAPD